MTLRRHLQFIIPEVRKRDTVFGLSDLFVSEEAAWRFLPALRQVLITSPE
jgi:hypothetical protein